MKKVLFLTLLCTHYIASFATTYYFAANGDDTRTTTQAQSSATPWKTLTKAQQIFSSLGPGDLLRFKEGDIFDGQLTTNASGTAASPIVITTWNDASTTRAIFDGDTQLTSWTSEGGGIYSSSAFTLASGDLNLVAIDGKPYAMGRYPNLNTSNGGYLTYESFGTLSITDNQNPLTGAGWQNSWVGAYLEVRTTHGSLERATISSLSGNTINYGPAFPSQYTLHNGYGYFVMGSLNTLDQYGEWYYNKSNHKLYIYFGDKTPSRHTINVPTIETGIEVQSSHVVLKNICLRYYNSYGVHNNWGNMQDFQAINCRFNMHGIDAIYFSGRDGITIQNCIFNNTMSNAIVANNANNHLSIVNNTIRNTGVLPGMAIYDEGIKNGHAIFTQVTNSTITDNEIYNTGYIGINFTACSNVDIERNIIDSVCMVIDDGGAIYSFTGTAAGPFTNRKVIGNNCTNAIGNPNGTTEGIAFGGVMYFDDNSQNVICDSNTFANSNLPGIYIHNSNNLQIRNNLVYNNLVQLSGQHDAGRFVINALTVTNNTLFSKKAAQRIMQFGSPDNDFATMGTFENNFYCSPYAGENNIILLQWYGNWDKFYSLEGTANTTTNWQKVFSYDQFTKKTPITISSDRQIFFTTSKKAAQALKFCKNCVDMAGTALDTKILNSNRGFLALSPSFIVP